MNYKELKDFLVTHLWKQGDQIVIDALDQLIILAEAELNRILRVEGRLVQIIPQVIDGRFELPDDCQVVRHVTMLDKGPMTYLSPFEFSERYSLGRETGLYYTTHGNILNVGGKPPLPTNMLVIWYYKKIPNYYLNQEDENNFWVVNYPDVFLYTILKHSAPFLREDERLAVWSALGNAAIEGALDENTDLKFAGSPIKMNFGRVIR